MAMMMMIMMMMMMMMVMMMMMMTMMLMIILFIFQGIFTCQHELPKPRLKCQRVATTRTPCAAHLGG
jgi:hypothetical protein